MYEIRVESSRRPPQAGGGMHTNNISDAASFFPSAAAPFSLDFLLLRLRKHCLLFLLVLFVIIIHIHRSCGLLFFVVVALHKACAESNLFGIICGTFFAIVRS